jgi:hypothetical protein
MKIINKLTVAALAGFMALAACEKGDKLPYYDYGTVPVLSSSASTLAPPAGDSNKAVLSLTWTDPQYNNVEGTTKYIVQIDTAGRNFAKAVTREVIGTRSYSFIGKELNSILLDNLGFQFGKPGTIEARVISSFSNNNQRLNSPAIKIGVTAYKVPPKVALPTTGKLFLVGDATEGGWTNPVPTPSQELTRIDETTFGGIFYLYGGAQYLVLPLNGNWDNKYAVANNTVPGLAEGGDFGFNLSQNFPGPQVDGWYKLTMDFQSGKFKMEPFTQQHGLPQALVAVGGATPNGWANEANNSQKFTRLNSTNWEITVNLKSGEEYLILPEPGNWGKKYGVKDNNIESAKLAGVLEPEGKNLKSPNETANYKIVVDFFNNSYKLTKQ